MQPLKYSCSLTTSDRCLGRIHLYVSNSISKASYTPHNTQQTTFRRSTGGEVCRESGGGGGGGVQGMTEKADPCAEAAQRTTCGWE